MSAIVAAVLYVTAFAALAGAVGLIAAHTVRRVRRQVETDLDRLHPHRTTRHQQYIDSWRERG